MELDDNSDALIVKRGSDFRDLSEIKIVFESTHKGNVRNKIVKSITVCVPIFFFCLVHGTDSEGMTQKEKDTSSCRDLNHLNPCPLY